MELPYVTSNFESQDVENLTMSDDMIDNVFFWGIPTAIDTTFLKAAHKGPFIGCLRDLVLQEFVDWSEYATNNGGSHSECD